MMPLPFALFLFSAAALSGQGHSYREEIDAIAYGQSFLVQALIEVCDEAFPEDAETLEKAWVAWEKANRGSVKRGKKAWAKIEKSSNPEADVTALAKETRDKVREESVEEKRKTCQTVLELLERES